MQNLISHGKCLGKGGLCIGNAEQVLVRDNNQRVDLFGQLLNPFLRSAGTTRAFKIKRLGDNTDCQNALLARSAGNHRCGARACAAAHAGCHKGHMRALQHVDNLGHGFFGCCLTDSRVGTGAQTLSQFGTDLNAPVGLRGR